jgi:hypothetical protein
MTADFSIQRRVLDVLCTLGGVALAERILVAEVAVLLPRKTDSDEIRTQLAMLEQSEFVEKQRGPLGEARWRRTPKGEAAWKDLQA